MFSCIIQPNPPPPRPPLGFSALPWPCPSRSQGRARLHPIGNGTDPWLPRVLQRLGALTGVPLLLHAMYDSLAAPQNIALNNISQALRLWQSEQRLDYVVVEDFMFGPRAAV